MNPYVYSKGNKSFASRAQQAPSVPTIGALVKSVFASSISQAVAFAFIIFAAGSVASISMVASAEIAQGEYAPISKVAMHEVAGHVLGARDGQLINKNGTVYLVGSAGLYGFPDLATFQSWGFTFSQIVAPLDSELTMSQVGLVPTKNAACTNPLDQISGTCGGVLKNSLTVSPTSLNFVVAQGSVGASQAVSLSWPNLTAVSGRPNALMIQVNSTSLAWFSLSESTTGTKGSLLPFPGNGTFYVSASSTASLAPGIYKGSIDINNLDQTVPAVAISIPVTLNITTTTGARVGQLINIDGTVYLVGSAGLYGIPSLEVFNSWGWTFNNVVSANAAEKALAQVGVVPRKISSCSTVFDQISGKCGTSVSANLTAPVMSLGPINNIVGTGFNQQFNFLVTANSSPSVTFDINWGDGSAITTLAGQQTLSGGFIVGALHTWTNAGSYTITVNAKDVTGAQSSAKFVMTVSTLAANDSTRLYDVKQTASALELYFNDKGRYPDNLSNLAPTYIAKVPQAPTPADGVCSASQNNYSYSANSSGSTYVLQFCLGATLGSYSSGVKYLTPAGISDSTNGIRVGQIINKNNTVYLVAASGLYGFPDLATFNSWGFTFSQIITANSAESLLTQVGVVPVKQSGCSNPLDQIAGTCGTTPSTLTITPSLIGAGPFRVIAGATGQLIGSFNFTNKSNVESVKLNNIAIHTGANVAGNLQNWSMSIEKTVIASTLNLANNTDANLSLVGSSPIIIAPQATVSVNVYADVLANANFSQQSMFTITSVTGVSATTGNAIAPMPSIAAQAITLQNINDSYLSVTVDPSTPLGTNITAGVNDLLVASYKITAGDYNVIVTDFAVYTLAGSDCSNFSAVKIYDQSGLQLGSVVYAMSPVPAVTGNVCQATFNGINLNVQKNTTKLINVRVSIPNSASAATFSFGVADVKALLTATGSVFPVNNISSLRANSYTINFTPQVNSVRVGQLININGTIYLVGTSALYGFPDYATFQSWGYSLSQIVSPNSFEVALSKSAILVPTKSSACTSALDQIAGNCGITVSPSAITISLDSGSVLKGQVGTSFGSVFNVSPNRNAIVGGVPDYKIEIVGNVPQGLIGQTGCIGTGGTCRVLDPNSIALVGMPTLAGSYDITVTATDLVTKKVGYQNYRVVISDSLVVNVVRPGKLININGTVYLVGNTALYPFSDLATFQSWGYSFSAIIDANAAEKALPISTIFVPAKSSTCTAALDQITGPCAAGVSAPVITSFAANPATITAGQPTTLSWQVTSGAIISIDNGIGAVTGISSKAVAPTQTTTYTLRAYYAGSDSPSSSATKTVTITVTPAGSGTGATSAPVINGASIINGTLTVTGSFPTTGTNYAYVNGQGFAPASQNASQLTYSVGNITGSTASVIVLNSAYGASTSFTATVSGSAGSGGGSASPTFTANGQQSITVDSGTTVNYAWSVPTNVAVTSYYTLDKADACGNGSTTTQYPWVATNSSGTNSTQVQSCQAGSTYTITLVATGYSPVSVTVKVNQPASAVSISGVQGYFVGQASPYNPDYISSNQYLVIYGNFAGKNSAGANLDSVTVNGVAQTVAYDSTIQLNVQLGTLSGNTAVVVVTNSLGTATKSIAIR